MVVDTTAAAAAAAAERCWRHKRYHHDHPYYFHHVGSVRGVAVSLEKSRLERGRDDVHRLRRCHHNNGVAELVVAPLQRRYLDRSKAEFGADDVMTETTCKRSNQREYSTLRAYDVVVHLCGDGNRKTPLIMFYRTTS